MGPHHVKQAIEQELKDLQLDSYGCSVISSIDGWGIPATVNDFTFKILFTNKDDMTIYKVSAKTHYLHGIPAIIKCEVFNN